MGRSRGRAVSDRDLSLRQRAGVRERHRSRVEPFDVVRHARRTAAADRDTDQVSGQVLLVENTRTAPLGTRILNLKRSAHTGDLFGAPTQALYFIVSLGITLQAISGALSWWNGRRRAG